MERPGDIIMRNGKFARIAISNRASPLEPTELRVARMRAEQQHQQQRQQRQEGYMFNASSAHVQVRSDSFFISAHDSFGSRPWTCERYMCKRQSLPTRHEMTTEMTDLPSPSPPPLLYVSKGNPRPGDSCADNLTFAYNPLGHNTEQYLLGKPERNKDTIFAKVQSYRKVLNKVYPPPPLVKKCSAKHLSCDPPLSLFGDINEHVVMKAARASLPKPPLKEHTFVPPGNLGSLSFACKNTNYTKTSHEQLMADVTALPSSLGTKQRCSSVSTNSATARSIKRCLSVPSILTSHAAQVMPSTPLKSNPSAYLNSSNMNRSMETPPPNSLRVVPPAPASRRLETNDPESCGGFAYDHDSMPKIIAVHSVTWKESENGSSQSEDFPLTQDQSEKATTRRETGTSDERLNHSCLDAHLNTIVADSRRCYPMNFPPEETKRKRFELSRHENVTNPTRQGGEDTRSTGAHQKHRMGDGCPLIRPLKTAGPHVSGAVKKHEFIDLTSFTTREYLSRYGHARAEQASTSHHQYRTSYAHANITLKHGQAHNASCDSPERIQMFSRTHQQSSLKSASPTVLQTVQGSLSFGNSGQLKFALQDDPNCKAACKPMLPYPKEMQNKNDQEGMVTNQSLLLSPPPSLAISQPRNEQTVATEDKEAMSTTDKLEELCKKILETRERFDQESIKWKKKLLRSLEIVLIKRLRKVERDTGQKADIAVPEELCTIPGKQKERQERQEVKTAKQRKKP